MGLQNATLFGMLHERIDWISQRQRVLAQNVANADTPNYRARDLKGLDFKKTLRNTQDHIALQRTHNNHIQGVGDNESYRTLKPGGSYEMSISGNNVVLEQQMSKVASNLADYQLATKIFGKYKSFHKIALQGKV